MAFSASRRSPALTNDATPRAIVSFGADSRAAPRRDVHARVATAGPRARGTRSVAGRARRRRRRRPPPKVFPRRRCARRRRRRRLLFDVEGDARARALARPSRVSQPYTGPRRGEARGRAREGGRDAPRAGGCPAFGRHRGRGRGRGRFARGRGGLRCGGGALVGFDAGRGGGRGLGGRRRALASLSSCSPMSEGSNTVASAALPPAAHVLSTSLRAPSGGARARPIARVLSFRLRRGCAEWGIGVVRGALARGGDVVRDRGHSCALGEGARFLSDCSRATHRRVRKLAHPLEGRRRVAHRGRATGQPPSRPSTPDARRALRRCGCATTRSARRGNFKILLSARASLV